jgi:hypothetical protein
MVPQGVRKKLRGQCAVKQHAFLQHQNGQQLAILLLRANLGFGMAEWCQSLI